MKYCFECGRMTGGDPLFCNFCGRSYDVKLCPRLHRNPRIATVCRECGSRELSTPHPRVSFFWHVFAFLIRVVLGSLLVFLSISIAVRVIEELLRRPEVQGGMILLGLLLLALWFLWAMLPDWLRRFIRHRLRRKERDDAR
jgi:ribosomal protein L40E